MNFRYWSNISHESVFTETTVDIGGEECFQLCYLGENLFVVATTTGSLIKVAVLGVQGNVTLDTRKVIKEESFSLYSIPGPAYESTLKPPEAKVLVGELVGQLREVFSHAQVSDRFESSTAFSRKSGRK